MSHWRKIVVDDKEYRWVVGSHHLVVQDADGVRIITCTAAEAKGISLYEWERGHLKGTQDGMLRPSEVSSLIKRITNVSSV